jgi:hypothetical protein
MTEENGPCDDRTCYRRRAQLYEEVEVSLSIARAGESEGNAQMAPARQPSS